MSNVMALMCGDALDKLRGIPDGSVDGVITDPPYNSGGMVRGDRTGSTQDKYISSDSGNRAKTTAFTGDNRDQRAYAYWASLWLSEALRATKPGGVCLLFTDWRQLPATTDALQAGGWVWRGIVPWYKPVNRPQLGRFSAACEYVVFGSAGPLPADRGVGALPGFYQASAPRNRVHTTQKPLEIMRLMVRIVPEGGIVLDPFMGSGTTGVAAQAEGRRFVGIESDPHYFRVASERLQVARLEAMTGGAAL